jgi:hypothetical protein
MGGAASDSAVGYDSAASLLVRDSKHVMWCGPNPYGHIVRISEARHDNSALTFSWDVFLLAGDPHYDASVPSDQPIFGSPDGLRVDPDGRLWIDTDISNSSQNLASRGYDNIANNAMLAAGPETGGPVRWHPFDLFGKQLQSKQRMPLVHVEPGDAVVAQRAQHPDPSDTEDQLLAEAVAIIAGVEVVGETPIAEIFVGNIGVEQKHRDRRAAGRPHLVSPGSYGDRSALHFDHTRAVNDLEKIIDRPRDRLLVLAALGVESLEEVALPMEKRHAHHGEAEVGRAPEGVPASTRELILEGTSIEKSATKARSRCGSCVIMHSRATWTSRSVGTVRHDDQQHHE